MTKTGCQLRSHIRVHPKMCMLPALALHVLHVCSDAPCPI
jgi:hypothetical protein